MGGADSTHGAHNKSYDVFFFENLRGEASGKSENKLGNKRFY